MAHRAPRGKSSLSFGIGGGKKGTIGRAPKRPTKRPKRRPKRTPLRGRARR